MLYRPWWRGAAIAVVSAAAVPTAVADTVTLVSGDVLIGEVTAQGPEAVSLDRKSTRLNSSHYS